MRVLADLFHLVEAETPAGGRSVSYERLGEVWLAPGPVRRRTMAAPPVLVATMTAETRDDGRLVAGRILRFSGADWRIVLAEPDPETPGRLRLSLERSR